MAFLCLEQLDGRLKYFTKLAPEEVMAYDVKIILYIIIDQKKKNYITIYFLLNLQ